MKLGAYRAQSAVERGEPYGPRTSEAWDGTILQDEAELEVLLTVRH